MPLFGIAGWSNAGKTTLIEKLTQHFAERGLARRDDQTYASQVRHRCAGKRHRAASRGRSGRDGDRLGLARRRHRGNRGGGRTGARNRRGAAQSGRHHSGRGLQSRRPSRRSKCGARPLQPRSCWPPSDPLVLAIAADYEVEAHGKPVFKLDDIAGIASLIEGDAAARSRGCGSVPDAQMPRKPRQTLACP